MSKYIDADQIRAEIERLKEYAESAKKEWNDGHYNQNAFAEDCRINSFNKLLSFLDTLQEQPVEDIKREWWNKGYREGRKNAHIPAKELGLPSSWDFQKEQPVEGLEEEIATWIPAHIRGGDDEVWKDTKKAVTEWAGIVARHFAEWGAEHTKQKPDCKYECTLTDEQLMATNFWKEYLKESLIPGSKPTKQDIDFLLSIARKFFSLVMKESCSICKDWSNG